MGFSEKDKKNSKHDIIQKWTYDNIESILSNTIMADNPYPFKVSTKKWEHQIIFQNGNYKAIIGYIDLLVKVDGKFYFPRCKEYDFDTLNLFIEVKTQIPSVGELIRQMRAYQTYDSGYLNKYLVVAPDDSHQELLREQGFWFYKYQDPTLLF